MVLGVWEVSISSGYVAEGYDSHFVVVVACALEAIWPSTVSEISCVGATTCLLLSSLVWRMKLKRASGDGACESLLTCSQK